MMIRWDRCEVVVMSLEEWLVSSGQWRGQQILFAAKCKYTFELIVDSHIQPVSVIGRVPY